MVERLLHHKNRTGVGAQKLLGGRRKELPLGLNSSMVQGWFVHRYQTVNPELFEYVIGLYEALPDNRMIEVSEKHREELQNL